MALPPLGTIVFISPSTSKLDQAIRHCNYFASFDPYEGGNDDFSFRLVAALNNAPAPSYSFQSVNFPSMYLSFKPTGLPSGMRVGIEESPDKNTASWTVAPTGASYFSLTTLSQVPSLAGKVLSVAGTHSGPCNNEREKPDAVLLTAASGSPSQAFAIGAPPSPAPSPPPPPPPPVMPATVSIDASKVDHALNPRLIGCHMSVN